LINLLTNAIKYNRPGGSVTVDAKVQGAQVLLQVRDTGRGLTAAQLRRLFEPFNRLGAEQGGIDGSGIGLAIVRAAVRQMGGTVQVSSEPDIGTCFEVQLPLVGASAQPPPVHATPATPTIAAAPGTQPADVLYIEDNAVNVLIVAALVRRRPDLVFHEATDGASGIAAARRLRPALVLIDMQLPDMDGIDVLHRLRADAGTADLRCVALSANAMQQDIHRALDAGFDGYWTKPLDFAAFAAALEAQFGPAPSAMARG
jgi:CheY-like chemotaxis protein